MSTQEDLILSLVENALDAYNDRVKGDIETTPAKVLADGRFVGTFDVPLDETQRFDALCLVEDYVDADVTFELI